MRSSGTPNLTSIVTFSVVYNLPKFFELHTGTRTRNLTLEDEGWVVNLTAGEDLIFNMTAAAEEDSQFIYSIEATDMRINEYYIKVRKITNARAWEWTVGRKNI